MISALFIWEAPPASREPSAFVSQPAIPIDGTADGLAWGRYEVDERATAWRVLMTVEMPRVGDGLIAVPDAPLAMFRRHRYRGRPLGDAVEVFVREGLETERVARALPEILR